MKNPLIDLFYQAEDYFFRSISKECLDFDELTTAYLTGVDTEYDNLIFIRKDVEQIDEIINRCKDFYKINNTPWNVVVTEQFISNDLERSLKNINFSFSGKSEAMFIELNKQGKHDNVDNMDIRSVGDTLDQWMKPLIEAFDLTFEVMRQYADVHERALKNKANFHHFTLFIDKMPISFLTVSLQANIARIHDVGTLPAYQNKGYATCLVKHAINEAINLGASYCFLEASESGISVYQKLGFKPLFKNNTYSHMVRTN
ncbi:MAG: GNAT family N-acetyltransferase [Gammaproteobacteria bacterium]|jgi:ribosomal protein S18 acetylase RimI-like enzyme|nr:GNAT family N-acetyltransferase [Gammaproteobacteria bacterium]